MISSWPVSTALLHRRLSKPGVIRHLQPRTSHLIMHACLNSDTPVSQRLEVPDMNTYSLTGGNHLRFFHYQRIMMTILWFLKICWRFFNQFISGIKNYTSLAVNRNERLWTLSITHWGRDKMAAAPQMTFSNVFSWMKTSSYWFKFPWDLFLDVQITMSQHWFWWWLGADQVTTTIKTNYGAGRWRIYASLDLNDFISIYLLPCCFYVYQTKYREYGRLILRSMTTKRTLNFNYRYIGIFLEWPYIIVTIVIIDCELNRSNVEIRSVQFSVIYWPRGDRFYFVDFCWWETRLLLDYDV